MSLRYLVTLFLLSLSSSSLFANEINSFPESLVSIDHVLPSAEHDELVFNYNSKNFDGSLLDAFSKDELIQMIKTNTSPEVAKGVKQTEFTIPFGPHVNWELLNASPTLDPNEKKSSFNLLNDFKLMRKEFSKESTDAIHANLEKLSEHDLRIFLSKKYSFLNSIGRTLENAFNKIRIRPPVKLIQGILNSLNVMFFQNTEQFVKSNTIGVPLFLTAGVGATIGKIIYNCLIAKTPLRKYISPNFGFYFSSSLGLSIAKIQSGTKSAWVLDLYFDFESLKRAFLPIFEGNAGVGSGILLEVRTIPEPGKNIYYTKDRYTSAAVIPILGSVRHGPEAIANHRTAIFALPISSTFYQTNVSRRALSIVLKRTKEPVSAPGPKKYIQASCQRYYSL